MSSTNSLPVLQAVHPTQYTKFTTEQLRDYFLLTDLKKIDSLNLTSTDYDRLSAVTVIPTKELQN